MTVKISNLPAATSVGSGDVIPVVQSGTTKKIDLNSPWSINIDGGAIDGTPIGANTASTGEFTTLDASGDVNFDSGTLFVDASADAVGIGTTSPLTKLVVSNSGAEGLEFAPGSPSSDISSLYAYNRSNNTNNLFSIGGSTVTINTIGLGRSEAMRIDSSGHAIIPAGVTLGTSAGVYNAANTLDDYETGTWTPGQGSQWNFTGGATLAGSAGTYTKIGNSVRIYGQLTLSASSYPNGICRITGLPFISQEVTPISFYGNNISSGKPFGIGYSTGTLAFISSSVGTIADNVWNFFIYYRAD